MNGMLSACFVGKTSLITVDDMRFIIKWPILKWEDTPVLPGHGTMYWLQTPNRLLKEWLASDS